MTALVARGAAGLRMAFELERSESDIARGGLSEMLDRLEGEGGFKAQ